MVIAPSPASISVQNDADPLMTLKSGPVPILLSLAITNGEIKRGLPQFGWQSFKLRFAVAAGTDLEVHALQSPKPVFELNLNLSIVKGLVLAAFDNEVHGAGTEPRVNGGYGDVACVKEPGHPNEEEQRACARGRKSRFCIW